ncbi:DUF3455 domain-containing protein [Plantactinospora solaniradicis]|uniref:DUF3455 domain-containing protein n=1 Tax=Plantactinospora solaniradicis TaxID=1723736 RepID=A0ABW1K471_9ACTN
MIAYSKWLSGAAGVSLLAALLIGGGGVASGTSPRVPADRLSPAPAALVPPAGNVLSAVYLAKGVQVYQCTSGAWTFVEPAAALTGLGRAGLRTAVHFRGPSWESTRDGSLVEARAVASSPVAGSIPELLLQATRNRGEGDFGAVTYLQRLATGGGAAPTGVCVDGATTGVSYRAEYRFFVAG